MNNDSQNNSRKIVDASRIVSLLKRLMKEQVSLTITTPDSDQEWYGTITEMLFHQGELVLNEIENVGSQQTNLNEGVHICHGKLTGVAIKFETNIVNVEKTAQSTSCRISYPTVITYHQRRGSERVGIWVDQKIPVIINMDGDATIKGHIRDISVDGLNACFYRIMPIAPNELFPSCQIQFPNDVSVDTKLEVRGLTINENIGQLHIRGKFVDISYDNRKKLQSYVKDLEHSLGDPN